jgi:CheY-like chemotaxis protein
MEKNPIVIIDDDVEDLELISEAFKELNTKNELLCFDEPSQALNFLQSSDQQPLFILCDVNMNVLDGFEFRKKLFDHHELRLKSIPFLFLSTGGNRNDIMRAYSLFCARLFQKARYLRRDS